MKWLGRMIEKREKLPIEKQFTVHTIKAEQRYVSKLIKQVFKEEISIIERIIKLHITLAGYFYLHSKIKCFMGLKYDENIVMRTILLDQIYLSLSILDLLKDGYYGSARVLLKQSFEMLMIAKCSEYNKNLREKWVKGEAQMKHVWNFLNNKEKKNILSNLRDLYKKLCKYTHSTPLSQQPLRLPRNLLSSPDINKNDVREELTKWIEKTEFIQHMQYTLDLFFVILNMLFHFNNIFHGKVRRFDFGYYKDRLGHYIKIRKIKDQFKELKAQYFQVLRSKGIERDVIKRWKKIIRYYTLNWN